MGRLTLVDRVRAWVGSVGWRLFLWGSGHTACGRRTDTWIEQRAERICFDCNVKRAARAVLADELAIGRAAVRALHCILPVAATEGYRLLEWGMRDEATELQNAVKAAESVLATDTAWAWLEDG